jgi:DNA primase large subunit
MDVHTLAKYPFLRETLVYIKERNMTLEDLIHDRAYAEARACGKSRVLEVIENREIKQKPLLRESECLMELLEYVVSRIIVSCVNDSHLIKWYALAEAIKTNRELENENVKFVLNVAAELGANALVDNSFIKVHFTDYLRYSSQIRGMEWKLVNRDLVDGCVLLPKEKFTRLLREVLRMKFELELPLPVTKEIISAFQSDVKEIKNKVEVKKKTFEAKGFGKMSITKMPPCMRHMLGMIQGGENLSHMGRFSLTAFLRVVGASSEDIIKIFATAPDFNESKTRYQVEHITGVISRTEYTPPSCSTMKSHGICYNPDNICMQKWMSHPLKYYRWKERLKTKGKNN